VANGKGFPVIPNQMILPPANQDLGRHACDSAQSLPFSKTSRGGQPWLIQAGLPSYDYIVIIKTGQRMRGIPETLSETQRPR